MSDDGKPIHLYMSGGGHRAGFGCIGVILALVHYGRWERVRQVVSVSGGSMINGALVSNAAADDESTVAAMRAMWTQMIRHGVKPWSTPRRSLGMAGGLALLAATVYSIKAVVWGAAIGGPAPRWLVVVFGLVILPVVVTLGRKVATVYFREFIVGSIAGPSSTGLTALSDADDLERGHIFCATGRVTSVPYYFVAGRTRTDFAWGNALQRPYSIADAAWASSSLPGLESVKAPEIYQREILVDGGASGMFGEQVNSRLERTADSAYAADARVRAAKSLAEDDAVALVVDAGSHAKPPSKWMRRLGPLSMIYVLGRWVKASMEATFVNDLHDFQGNHQIHITESGRVWRRSPTAELGPAVKRAPVVVANEDGTFSSLQTDGDILDAVNRGRSETRGLGLLGITAASSIAPIVVGFVATALEFNPSLTADELASALGDAGTRLGAGDALVVKWQELFAF